MTDTIKIIISNSSLIGWIQIFVTIGLLFAAIWAGITAKRSFQLNAFSELLKELTSEEARKDRGQVRGIQSNDITHIKELVELVRKEEMSRRANLGRAAERTIARFDRVGFFVTKSKTQKDAPQWLWTLVKDMWEKLGEWVKHRQLCELTDPDFYHKAYGHYFEELENYRIKHNL